jgi:sarcosine oxidase, subunit delta
MQLFPCPFCGPRAETEFFFAGEAGTVRPEPAGEVSDEAWADYLHCNDNVKGSADEIWVHLTCGEFFAMRRDTLSHEVAEIWPLQRAGT